MSETNATCLVTGANGFVGSRLFQALATSGFQVIAGVRKTSDLSFLSGVDVEYRYGDVTQPDTLPAMVAGCDYVIHNAGLVKASSSDQFFRVNERGTESLCKAVAEHNPLVKKFVYISSLAVMGPSVDGTPIVEDSSPRPITTYARSKLAGEQAALRFVDRFPVLLLRPSGVYGPGDREIFSFFEAVNRRIKPLIGNSLRKLQLVHVDDLSRAVVMSLSSEAPSGEAYIIAESRAYTLAEAGSILENACGKSGLPLILPSPIFRFIAMLSEFACRLVGVTPMLTREKATELLASWEVSTAKAEQYFGFVSQISFERGARETFKWYYDKGWLK